MKFTSMIDGVKQLRDVVRRTSPIVREAAYSGGPTIIESTIFLKDAKDVILAAMEFGAEMEREKAKRSQLVQENPTIAAVQDMLGEARRLIANAQYEMGRTK